MFKTTKSKRYGIATIVLAVLIVVLIVGSMSSCSAIVTELLRIKGELIGNDYNISQYDNFGNRTMLIHADKVKMDAETDNAGNPTSYVAITIDGYEWKHVGATLIFAQKDVDMITDFSIPDEINSTGETSSGLMVVDRFINNYKNLFGRKEVVMVSSQTGTPICLFRGDKVHVSIPSDLPKMTLINIDGKLVYVHRADVDIIPTPLFDN